MGGVWLLLLTTLSILAAVVPAVAYSVLVWWLDRYEKEPWGLLAATFIWGALPAVLLSIIGEFVLGLPFATLFGETVLQAIGGRVVAPVVEEAVKGFAILLVFLIFSHEFDGLLDGIVYGSLVGFGFGMTENIFYFTGGLTRTSPVSWVTLVLLRTVVFGLNHGLFSGITGIGFGYASMANRSWKRWLAPPLAFGGAVVVHAVHNASISLAGELCWPVLISLLSDWGGVLVVLAIVFLSWDQERRWIVEELSSEIGAGILSQSDYEIVESYWRRILSQWRALSSSGLRHARHSRELHQLATELAFKKHQLRGLRHTENRAAEIARLRKRIRDLRAEMAQEPCNRGETE